MIKDGRGENTRKMGIKNLETVRDFLKKNENTTIKEICEGVGMSYKTVRKHVDAIKRGELS